MKMLAEIVDKDGKVRTEEIEREENDNNEMARVVKGEQIKKRLAELTKDFAQIQAGIVVPNIEGKKAEFRALLNEIRQLEGKQPREFC